MAREFPGTNNNHLYRTSANSPASVGTITVACWFRVDNTSDHRRIFGRHNSGDGNAEYQLLALSGTTDLRWGYFVSGGLRSVTATISMGQVYHFIGLAGGSVAGQMFLDGSSVGTPAASAAAIDTDDSGISIGGLVAADGTPGTSTQPHDGMVAEIAEWNRLLSTAERAALVAGCSPALIPNGLRWYVPLIGGTSDAVAYFGSPFVEYGTISAAVHPAIIMPDVPRIGVGSGAAPSGVSIPVVMHHRKLMGVS